MPIETDNGYAVTMHDLQEAIDRITAMTNTTANATTATKHRWVNTAAYQYLNGGNRKTGAGAGGWTRTYWAPANAYNQYWYAWGHDDDKEDVKKEEEALRDFSNQDFDDLVMSIPGDGE